MQNEVMSTTHFARPMRDIKDAPQSAVSMVSDFSQVTDDGDNGSQFKLRIQTLPLFGRGPEVESLKASYEAVSATGKSELIFCHGASGVGKSKLIQSLRDPVFAQGGFFVTGKFDQLLSNAPYSAIVAAFSDLCDLIYHSPRRDEICNAIREAFAELEMNVLVRLIPSLKYLMGVLAKDTSEVENSQLELTRFKILCRRFMGVLATEKHPLVLVLDDLQWSDQSSVDLIQSILQREDSHLLVICAYRNRTQNKGTLAKSPLHVLLESCGKESFLVKVKHIHLSGLDIDALNQVVADITNRQPCDTLALSEVILQKTLGNAYFCVRFLEMLEAQSFLFPITDEVAERPHIEPTQWDWNLIAVQNETNATDNVATLVMDKLQRVDPVVQLVLMYAAFLGYWFPYRLLKQIIVAEGTLQDRGVTLNGMWAELDEAAEGTSSDSYLTLVTVRALNLAISEGLIEQTGTLVFKFSHDCVQDCLLKKMMGVESQLLLLHLRIGRVICCVIENNAGIVEDWMVFLAVDSINKAAEHLMDDPEQRLRLVKLNLEAGELAASKCAYVTANGYLRRAVSSLSQDSWAENYSLCLKVHEVAAETEHCTGNIGRSHALIRTIIENASCREDTMRAYQTQVAAFTTERNLGKAVEVALSALRQFDIKFPNPRKTTFAHVIVELAKTQYALSKYSFEELQHLPLAQDANMIASGKILSAAALCAYMHFGAGRNTFALIALRGVRLTLKFGLSSRSTQAFAGYGAIMSIFGNPKLGYQYANLAHRLTEQLNARDTEARTIVTNHTNVLHWSKAMEDTHDELSRGYRIGMEHADINYAFASYEAFVESAFVLGIFPFSKVEKHAGSFIELAKEFNVLRIIPNLLSIHQATANLMGSNESDPARLCGDIADEVDLVAMNARTKNDNSRQVVNFHALILAFHFENIPLLEKYVVAVEENHRRLAGHFLERFMLFYIGMAHSLLYKRSGLRKHRSGLRKMASIFRSWSKKGYANNEPLAELLNLELVASTTKLSKGQVRYDACQKAIDASFVAGLGVSGAMSYERAALVMLELKDRNRAIDYADIAISRYDELEMFGKAEFLERKWRSLLNAT